MDELCARVVLYRWTRRLSTLQEGSLPAKFRRLVFQFKNSAIKIDTLHEYLKQAYRTSIFHRGFAGNLLYVWVLSQTSPSETLIIKELI